LFSQYTFPLSFLALSASSVPSYFVGFTQKRFLIMYNLCSKWRSFWVLTISWMSVYETNSPLGCWKSTQTWHMFLPNHKISNNCLPMVPRKTFITRVRSPLSTFQNNLKYSKCFNNTPLPILRFLPDLDEKLCVIFYI